VGEVGKGRDFRRYQVTKRDGPFKGGRTGLGEEFESSKKKVEPRQGPGVFSTLSKKRGVGKRVMVLCLRPAQEGKRSSMKEKTSHILSHTVLIIKGYPRGGIK